MYEGILPCRNVKPRLHDATFVEQHWWIFVETSRATKIVWTSVQHCRPLFNNVVECSSMLLFPWMFTNINVVLHSRIVQTGFYVFWYSLYCRTVHYCLHYGLQWPALWSALFFCTMVCTVFCIMICTVVCTVICTVVLLTGGRTLRSGRLPSKPTDGQTPPYRTQWILHSVVRQQQTTVIPPLFDYRNYTV